MTVAFVADTHDRTDLARVQVETAMEQGVETLVHLGDVTRPSTLRAFRHFPLYAVHGNGDGSRLELERIVERTGGRHLKNAGTVSFGAKTFYLHHGIDHGKSYGIAGSETGVDYVLHGHWHNQERTQKKYGEVLNPGSEGMYVYDPKIDAFEYYDWTDEFETP